MIASKSDSMALARLAASGKFAPERLVTLTGRQAQILEHLIECSTAGVPPTFREICAHFGIKSPNGVQETLKSLERKGFISRDANLSRSIRILADKPAVVCPHCGKPIDGAPTP